jgi:aspartate 1-decarboxylase
MQVNGAAARLVQRGDTIIVISYATYDEEEVEGHAPRVVHVSRDNEIVQIDHAAATLVT